VQGGTVGNLSALVTARDAHRAILSKAGVDFKGRLAFIASKEAHSSLKSAAKVMDVDILLAGPEENGKLLAGSVQEVLAAAEPNSVFAIVATGGTTNFGIVDDLRGIGEVAKANKIWYHIDGAYGLAGILSPKYRQLFDGSELADSFIVDPHKWLFGPYDSCALIYRNPEEARNAHTQHAEYLDVLQQPEHRDEAWNPADLAHHLSRRARGLPFWFSLAMHGTDAYRDAMEATLDVTRKGAELIRKSEHLELVLEPELSVLVFRRSGWSPAQYQTWSDRILTKGIAFVVPSSWQGETVLRFCIVNPRTTVEGIAKIIDTLK
jgi:glutamate/tyrosine decarboxylase-like PLP-dependent enzyme